MEAILKKKDFGRQALYFELKGQSDPALQKHMPLAKMQLHETDKSYKVIIKKIQRGTVITVTLVLCKV